MALATSQMILRLFSISGALTFFLIAIFSTKALLGAESFAESMNKVETSFSERDNPLHISAKMSSMASSEVRV